MPSIVVPLFLLSADISFINFLTQLIQLGITLKFGTQFNFLIYINNVFVTYMVLAPCHYMFVNLIYVSFSRDMDF